MEGCGSGVRAEGRALEVGGGCRPRHGKTLRIVAEGGLLWEARARPNRSGVKSFT